MPENNSIQGKKEEKIKTVVIQKPWRIFGWEALLFCLTLGIGIATAFKINKVLKIEKIILPQISFWQFLLYFLGGTLFIFLIVFFLKQKRVKGIIFKTLFILIGCWGGLVTLSIWIPDAFSLILIAVLILWWIKKPSVLIHDLVIILGIAGISSILGLQLTPLIIVLLLIILSIYDFIAVYKTKHMVKMAKEMIETGTILALIVPQEISDFKEHLKEIKPGEKFLILGGGDVAFPLLLCVSLIPEGIINSLIVAIFALAGLFLSFYFFISQKIRQPIPALPPIAFFSIIGYLLTLLI